VTSITASRLPASIKATKRRFTNSNLIVCDHGWGPKSLDSRPAFGADAAGVAGEVVGARGAET
jgi:hypothetical protein